MTGSQPESQAGLRDQSPPAIVVHGPQEQQRAPSLPQLTCAPRLSVALCWSPPLALRGAPHCQGIFLCLLSDQGQTPGHLRPPLDPGPFLLPRPPPRPAPTSAQGPCMAGACGEGDGRLTGQSGALRAHRPCRVQRETRWRSGRCVCVGGCPGGVTPAKGGPLPSRRRERKRKGQIFLGHQFYMRLQGLSAIFVLKQTLILWKSRESSSYFLR